MRTFTGVRIGDLTARLTICHKKRHHEVFDRRDTSVMPFFVLYKKCSVMSIGHKL